MTRALSILKYNKLTWFIRCNLWRFGLDICSYPPVGQLLARCDLAIDCGANKGQTRNLFRSLGYKGKIVSIEAAPELVGHLHALKIKTGDKNWEIISACLSDEEGVKPFYLGKTSLQNSLLSMDRFSTKQVL